MNRHPDTFLTLAELGSTYPDYRPTFDFGKPYIDGYHEFFATCPTRAGGLIQVKNNRPVGDGFIPGWLRRADALKLHELAYCVRGDILEIGCYHGLSTTILSQANRLSPHRKHIDCVDNNPECIKAAQENLRARGLSAGVTMTFSDATVAVKAFAAAGRKFEFAFIDHAHAYEPVYTVCRELDRVMLQGGFCLFHDFNDPRNREAGDADYGVYQAVSAALDPARFEFYGIYGCTGLYRVT